MASRPTGNSARLRQRESIVYAEATRSGSRVFHPSSARRTFWMAVSRVKGGRGGREATACCCCVMGGLLSRADVRCTGQRRTPDKSNVSPSELLLAAPAAPAALAVGVAVVGVVGLV